MKTRISLKYFVSDFLWKQFFAPNSTKDLQPHGIFADGGAQCPPTHTHTHTHKKTREWVIPRAITGPLRQRQAIHRHAIHSVRPEAAKRTKQYCIHNAIPDTLPNHEHIILNHEIYEQLPPLTIVFPRPNPIPEPFSQQLTQGHLTCAFIH